MELRHLRYFVCVADEQNIGRAALRLHISQPPLTRQIQQLEEQLGAQLLHRTSRGVELTDAGRVLYEDARNILALADRAAERTSKAAQGLLGRVDVAVFGSGIFGAIPLLLRHFRRRCPEVNIVLHNMSKEEQIDALRHQRITLAFNRLMRPVEGLTCETLLTEPLYVALPAGDPLIARTAVPLAELSDTPVVLYPTGSRPNFIDKVHALCRDCGFAPLVAQEVSDVVHAVALVATGFGVCLVPRSATAMAIPGVTYRPLHHPAQPRVDLCCIYRDGDDSPILQALLGAMRAAAAEMSPHDHSVLALPA
ncbi:LysR family transcriptional regulator [Ideonella livida]|uniref:LysR family transcriptional regulator n=1 Tax=Ideonella livida TaxID=2707176 RepID=A0A7C9PJD4_9BURK|nr:LysR family transcriptional regulator [Ideonella livida]NDY93455.1 LysR family transcriptional regulator [Ideonella livida]